MDTHYDFIPILTFPRKGGRDKTERRIALILLPLDGGGWVEVGDGPHEIDAPKYVYAFWQTSIKGM